MRLKIATLLAATTLCAVTACNPTDENKGKIDKTSLKISATVAESDAASSIHGGDFRWSADDAIYIMDSRRHFNTLSITEGAGTATATFSGEFGSDADPSRMAVWPARPGFSWSESKGLTVYMPDEYDADKAHTPMVATFKSTRSTLKFRYLCGSLHLSVIQVPVRAKTLRFAAKGLKLSGNFQIADPASSSAVISAEPTEKGDSVIFVTLPQHEDMETVSLDFPVPAGTYPRATVSLYDDDGVELSRGIIRNASVRRGEALRFENAEFEKLVFRFIDYNVLQGMKNDYADNMDNFVAWVRSQGPDILVLCEAKTFDAAYPDITNENRPMPENIATLAARWGHSHTAVGAYQDNFPVLITSRYPIELIQTLSGKTYSHGGFHARVEGVNIVALHTKPAHNTVDDEIFRLNELKAATECSLLNPAYAGETKWILTGDLNSYWRGDYEHYTSSYKNKAWDDWQAQEYLHSVWDHDVLYDFHQGAWQPTMYHGNARIDYIMCNENVYQCVKSAKVLHDSFTDSYTATNKLSAADHRPVEMTFDNRGRTADTDAGAAVLNPVGGEW